jgi:hypothetical protein
MSGTSSRASAEVMDIQFTFPDAVGAADTALATALDFCTQKMGLNTADGALLQVRAGNPEARSYFEYGLSKGLAEHISALDQEVTAVYLYEDEATPEDIIFGQAKPSLIHLIIWAQRKTGALDSLLVALERAVSQRYTEMLELPELTYLLDVQIVDDAEVKARVGYGSLLNSLHLRPLPVWKR